jgi:hypothetical protein
VSWALLSRNTTPLGDDGAEDACVA